MDPTPQVPDYVRWVVDTLEQAGYETWTVGGAVRNTLLGIPPGDWDLATRATPQVVQGLFPRTVPVGVDHGTVGVLTRQGVLLEVTTFRKDIETTGRHAVVEFADTLQEDLARRDFTVNAVAWHPIRREYSDPFSGREDLKEKVLRTVGTPEDRFSEDYLRVLRALRFSGRFKLRIDDPTWAALCACTDHLDQLSPERIREELLKVLTEDLTPSETLALYEESGVLGALYPELSAVSGCRRSGRDEDLWEHSLRLVDQLSSRRPILRLAALLHGVGIAGSPDPAKRSDSEDPAGDREEERRARARERAAAALIRGRYSNQEIREVSEIIGIGLEPPLDLPDAPALRGWLNRA
ncbi:MAG: CCA tRNA nucleotidyltransferase, partial [Gemmatimonadetes bacterium]|nr:CCA tRNA nucleotidyltransferase [Gemmatimonadota bacterium]